MKRNVEKYDYQVLNDAKNILMEIDMPKELYNPRCVMIFCACAQMIDGKSWRHISEEYMSVHDIIKYVNDVFPNKAGLDKKGYQENSRETFRDETLKRWVSAAIIESKAGLAANDRNNGYRFTSAFAALNGSVLTLANWNYLYIKGNSMNSINSNARDNLNHAVVIVGWDDNYDKSNFLQKPKNNGAFLVRNSWGTNDHGYYWVSYEDKSIVPTYTIQDYEKTASNERIYNLEEGALCPTVTINKKTAGFVNIFSLKGKEQLDKISFYTSDVGAEYQIYYVPLDQDGNLDLNGMKAISESGTVNYEGYYTKQIKSPIIKQGKVAIMVVIKSSGKNTSMGAEGTYDAASAKYYVPSISKEESYLVTDYGSQDSYKENYGNWTIKLTTRNANDKSVTQDNKIQNIKKEITEKDLGLHSISDLELDAGNVVYN